MDPHNRIQYVEEVRMYMPGGLHPVDIGDVIGTNNRQYEVVHKLGYGSFSTVWLVRSCGPVSSHFALKILRADVTDVVELRILQHLGCVDGLGHPNVVSLHDSFKVVGPNGNHQCLVLPVLGPSLQDFKVVEALLGPMRLQVCQQVAGAVAFLHDRGICHGDLTASNVVFELPNVQSISLDRLLELLGPIRTERLHLPNRARSSHVPPSSQHFPKKLVERAAFSGLDYSLLTQVRIVDFGQAFFVNNPPLSLGIPIDFFPPELCFGYLPSPKSDIWHLACVLWKVHCKSFIFPTFFEIFEVLLSNIVSYLGPLPQHWMGRFNFDKYGYREPDKEPNTTELTCWFEDKPPEKSILRRLSTEAPHLTTRQQEEYVRLLHNMLAYEPDNRLSAEDILKRLNSPTF
ncbi:kinase domain-containing protein [Hypoxylon crocopeplum]|nr:kinase domain-containing protein [Hypoxylon crocopeplum]